jgi:hypothetical protein
MLFFIEHSHLFFATMKIILNNNNRVVKTEVWRALNSQGRIWLDI